MTRRFVRCMVASGFLCAAAGASAEPSYCPTVSPPAACGQASIGDLLITLHGPAKIVGLNPWTRGYYVFSDALAQLSSTELGDIAVLPNDPVQTVVIGNVDDLHQLGIRRLDACGNLAPASSYGTFPASWPDPWPHVGRQGTNNRGIVFSPLDAQLFSPSTPQTFPYDPYQVLHGALFRFPAGGGDATLLATSGSGVDPVNPANRGAAAADEFGNLYLGETTSTGRVNQIRATTLVQEAPVELAAASFPLLNLHDLVHDGNHHVFATDFDWWDEGKVYRFDLSTGRADVWTANLGPAFGYSAFNQLNGITLDAAGDLWVVESYADATDRAGIVKISGQTGEVLDYFPLPAPLFGTPLNQAGPFGIAVYGVNLPAVRERCAGTCGDGEIMDCYGACLPAEYLGDGICDAGPSNSLNCYARGYDGGTCNPCPANEIPDCNGNCSRKDWLGDGVCDEGGWEYNGHQVDFDCRELRYDEATCQVCNPGETPDCNDNCAPGNWLGDDICDSAGWVYDGNYIDFDCVEHDFDQGRCQ